MSSLQSGDITTWKHKVEICVRHAAMISDAGDSDAGDSDAGEHAVQYPLYNVLLISTIGADHIVARLHIMTRETSPEP